MQTFEPHKCSSMIQPRTGRFLGRFMHDACADPDCSKVRGGLEHDSAMVRNTIFFPYVIVPPSLISYSPASPHRSSGKGQDGSDPPLFASLSANGEGGLEQALEHSLPPPFFGVAPVQFIPAGRLRTRTPSGR